MFYKQGCINYEGTSTIQVNVALSVNVVDVRGSHQGAVPLLRVGQEINNLSP